MTASTIVSHARNGFIGVFTKLNFAFNTFCRPKQVSDPALSLYFMTANKCATNECDLNFMFNLFNYNNISLVSSCLDSLIACRNY